MGEVVSLNTTKVPEELRLALDKVKEACAVLDGYILTREPLLVQGENDLAPVEIHPKRLFAMLFCEDTAVAIGESSLGINELYFLLNYIERRLEDEMQEL